MSKRLNKLFTWYSSSMKNHTLLVVTSIVLTLTAIFIAFFSYYHFNAKLNDIYYENEKVSQNAIENIDQYFDTVAAIASDANYNYYLQDYLINAVNDGEVADKLKPGANVLYDSLSSKLFSSYFNTRSDISSIFVIGNNSMLLHKSIYNYWSYILDYSKLNWYTEAKNNPSDYIITGPQKHPFLLGNTEKTFSVSKSIQSSQDGSFLGVIVIDINLNEISSICDSAFTNRKSHLFIKNDNDDTILEYSPDGEDDIFSNASYKDILNKALLNGEKNFKIKVDNENYYCTVEQFDKASWSLITLYPSRYLYKDLISFTSPMILLMLISLIIVSVILNRVLTNIIHPLTLLTNEMDLLDSTDKQLSIDHRYYDERGKLIDSFNEMVKRINSLMKEVIKEQEDKRIFELQALHSQINPHFLYNTLDTIVWMAELHDDNIIPVTESLAKLFRISLNKGLEFISIYDELDHVKNYLFIQCMRYGDKLSYDFQFDPKIKEKKIIKLIIQPLVENSIYHGIKQKEGNGKITVSAFIIDEEIEIKVIDDGVGMNEESCNRILQDDYISTSSKGSGVGVRNVNKRIKLYYGDQYGVFYSSKEGVGTCATIKIPLKDKENFNEN